MDIHLFYNIVATIQVAGISVFLIAVLRRIKKETEKA